MNEALRSAYAQITAAIAALDEAHGSAEHASDAGEIADVAGALTATLDRVAMVFGRCELDRLERTAALLPAAEVQR